MYIDPAATTVIITSISGIVIAVGATAVIIWRKAKKKVAKKPKPTKKQDKNTETKEL